MPEGKIQFKAPFSWLFWFSGAMAVVGFVGLLGITYLKPLISRDKSSGEQLDRPERPTSRAEVNLSKLIGSGVVKAIDRSNPFLRDAGQAILVVGEISPAHFAHEGPRRALASATEGFQVGDKVDLYLLHDKLNPLGLPTLTLVAIRQPPPAKPRTMK